jgi:GPH family glycoside/pentoside/hexuronide:cation symporter
VYPFVLTAIGAVAARFVSVPIETPPEAGAPASPAPPGPGGEPAPPPAAGSGDEPVVPRAPGADGETAAERPR